MLNIGRNGMVLATICFMKTTSGNDRPKLLMIDWPEGTENWTDVEKEDAVETVKKHTRSLFKLSVKGERLEI